MAQDQLLDQLHAATAVAEVDATVVVQAQQTLEESDWLISLAEKSNTIAGVVGWVPLMAPEVIEHLGRLAAHSKFKGVRHVLQGEPAPYFLSADIHRGLALLPDLDLRYDLLIFQKQLPVAIQLADRQPDLGIIIGHLATLRAYFEQALELFGPERLLFGTDWPVCLLRIGSYQAWADTVRGYVSTLTPVEQRAILHDNASRIYHLGL